ncbi:epimerase [Pseudoclavibacter endophyticus]|uniref:TIGR01777 family protein n=1 Tax=Pseudoclavibacter endophyticus TaxID=1778590 RepID=A0A6H9WLC5_9MICO|nr:TIGR01777 family oxidoreductase [Pseudoclavibacter endophyticus]KAB1649933.1 TIGR01777 family protein [Pseudoclavibacter endophyticus]GGA58625.1 epimerase [Pseudoclavibacter endophyticus]
MGTNQSSAKHIVVAGASGLIGRSLIASLESSGHLVTQLVRREPAGERERRWDPNGRRLDARIIDGADAVVNLAGSRLGRLPWTYPVKKDILRSRVNATLTITKAIAACEVPPRTLINASAMGVYGDRPDEVLNEESAVATDGFLPKVVERWEAAARTAPEGTRVVLVRFGLVVGESGFLPLLKALGQLGLLTQLGDGTQHWPWVGIRDTVRAVELALKRDDVSGPLIVAGPTPCTSDEFMTHLASRLGRPRVLKTPKSLIGFTLREAGRELFLFDQRAEPKRLLQLDMPFREATAQQAIDRALRSPDFADIEE